MHPAAVSPTPTQNISTTTNIWHRPVQRFHLHAFLMGFHNSPSTIFLFVRWGCVRWVSRFDGKAWTQQLRPVEVCLSAEECGSGEAASWTTGFQPSTVDLFFVYFAVTSCAWSHHRNSGCVLWWPSHVVLFDHGVPQKSSAVTSR